MTQRLLLVSQLAALCAAPAAVVGAQQRDTTARTGGSLRLRPFLGFNNVFNRSYVGSVVINAARGRYFEPAPGRNMYLGFSLGAGE